ncbi:DUF624 domain-containing protein [Roseburia hominis]
MNLYGRFLGNDSTFGRVMTKWGMVIAINILFVISCIPFFTIGAAAVAMYYAVFEILNSETPVNPFRAYFKGLRKQFLPATVSWLAFVGVIALGTVNLQICEQAGGWIQYLSTGVIAVLVASVIVMVYLLPVFAVFSGKMTEKIKLSVCIAMSHPLKMLLILLLHAVPLVIVYVDKVNRPTYAFISAFFGFGLLAYVIGKMLVPLFKPYFNIMEAD